MGPPQICLLSLCSEPLLPAVCDSCHPPHQHLPCPQGLGHRRTGVVLGDGPLLCAGPRVISVKLLSAHSSQHPARVGAAVSLLLWL